MKRLWAKICKTNRRGISSIDHRCQIQVNMALSGDAAALANLLAALSQPDTEAIRQAEVALKPLLKDPRCVPAIVEIIKAKETQVSNQVTWLLDMAK